MKTKYVKINQLTDIKSFIQKTFCVDGDVICRKGYHVVDGKSILGILSIDTSTGVTIEYPETATDLDEFLSQFEA